MTFATKSQVTQEKMLHICIYIEKEGVKRNVEKR